ncbi:SCO2523 family variant P-loop protein [Streptomyces sp. CB01373]|uniref:SCO2523 family variant P-loop protein n=1 Tax=Streptomyces sp. CB01373 TaxID=2020325 RepID=UPI000C27E0B5|nr:SCO2523 family variant P-loop protein [Streptomyces sp. CB01373]PJM95258.1 DNA-binding protein [Streptomyces sp. CB01373]
MLVFAASDKGGTGRSVTSANIAFRRALAGDDVCYLDFDFGSPTAAAVFDVPSAMDGVGRGGLHSYLQGQAHEPVRLDVWAHTEHRALRHRPAGSGNFVLFPGDRSGGEFAVGNDSMIRCTDLFLRLHSEFDMVLVDLSAGRSYAVDLALEVTARPELHGVGARWLIHHRWTRQHVIAASGFAFGPRGIVSGGIARGHDAEELRGSMRFVRAAVPDPGTPPWPSAPSAQSAWMRTCDQDLHRLAADRGVGHSAMLGSVPLEPVLQWREQLITEEDVLSSRVAGPETLKAFQDLAGKLTDDDAWGMP